MARVTFAGLDPQRIQGAEFTFSRGVSPSSARIFLDPPSALSQMVGTLVLADSQREVEFSDCALAPQTLRLYKGRDPWMWSVQVMDRRWKWRYPRISGEYNRRGCDGVLVEASRKTLLELLRLLLEALGENNPVLDGVPDGIFPGVNWDAERADLELAHLCELHGLIVWLGLDNLVHVAPLGSGAGLDTSPDDIIPRFRYEQAVLPANIEVRGAPRILQRAIPLRPVGLDVDGTVKPIDELSYVPAGGWSRCWYTTFSEVPIGDRHLAFKSVWRWWEPVIDGLSPGLDRLEDLRLLPAMAEAPANGDGIVRCTPPLILGTFWPQSDHNTNTGPLTPYAGEIEIDAKNWLVKTLYPVVSIDSDGITEPTLYLVTAFTIAGDSSRPSALTSVGGLGPNRIAVRNDLREIDNGLPIYTSAGQVDVGNELQAVADALAAGHQGRWASELVLEGVRKVDLTGKIAQVRWKVGVHDGRPITTRVSENMEFDVFVPHHAERRRRERGDQVSGRVLR